MKVINIPLKISLISILFIFQITIYSQTDTALEKILKEQDISISSQNLEYHNGRIHKNYDITINKETHRYFNQNVFVNGTIVYNSQPYYNINLKYDILEDELVIQPNTQNKTIAINLIKKNLNSFTINKTNFIYISPIKSRKIAGGFYEKEKINSKFTLLIKHIKNKRDIIKDDKILLNFSYKKEYYLEYNNVFSQLNSIKSLYKIFPQYQKNIEKIYSENKNLKNLEEEAFYIYILKSLSNQL